MTTTKENVLSKCHETVVHLIITLAVMLTAGIILFLATIGSTRGPAAFSNLVASSIAMAFATVLLIYCCLMALKKTKRSILIFTASVLLYISTILCFTIDYFFRMPNSGNLIFILQTILSLIIIFIQLSLWFYEISSLPESHFKKIFSAWFCILSTIYTVLTIVNIFTKFLFYYDDFGELVYGGANFDAVFFILAYLSYLAYVLPQKCALKKKLSLAAVAIIPLFSIALIYVNSFFEIVYEGSSTLIVALLVATYTVFFGDYIEGRNLLIKQEAELAEQSRKQTELQASLMLSQIKPHFLFNAITAIRNICKTDPAEAYDALGIFADYMRANMDSFESGKMISFDKELEHTKMYLSLEQMRFGEDFSAEFDIQYKDFMIPALALQAIVENAVLHGAIMNENGGKVIISSLKADDNVIITVRDNGPGFDPNIPLNDGRNHFGIANVKNSLTIKNCGELYIDSTPGNGTTVTIKIKGEK